MNVTWNRTGCVIDNIDPKTARKVKRQLTVRPKTVPGFPLAPSFEVFQHFADGRILLPRFFAAEFFKCPYRWKQLLSGDSIASVFRYKLRPAQLDPVEKMLESLEKTGGGILSVPPGTGKTVMALYIATVIKRRTLVVVHNEHLLHQWKRRIEQFTDMTVGTIRSDTVDLDHDIVICMLQSISMRTYPRGTFDCFGFIVVDECHHMAARVFSQALRVIGCPVMMGLSATPERADGLERVYQWYLGPVIVRKGIERDVVVRVKMVRLMSKDAAFKTILNRTGKSNVVAMTTELSAFDRRTRWIVQIVLHYVSQGRQILVLSHRKKHVAAIASMVPGSGIIVGQMKPQDVNHTIMHSQVIVATYNSVEEGFDCSRLDTLVMATPKKTIAQTVGRILRKEFFDVEPIIVDIEDDVGVFCSQASHRRTFYRKQAKPDFAIVRSMVDLDTGMKDADPDTDLPHAAPLGDPYDHRVVYQDQLLSETECLL